MKTLKYLPLTIALVMVGCTEMTPPGSGTGASAGAPTMAAMAAPPAAPEPLQATAAAPSPSPMVSSEPVATATESSAFAPTRTKHSASVVSAPIASGESASHLAKGEKVYATTCVACHGAGLLGAPKFGDKAMWGPRIAQGINTLHTNAINGIRFMPPKGGNASLSDGDVKAAVDYMISKAS